jgi:hypothetical protein
VGPRGHEGPHHAVVLEHVPGRVCVIWAGFLEEPLDVMHRWPHLTLFTVRGGPDATHARTACLPVVAIIVVGRGHGPLRALLPALFATLDALLRVVGGDVGRRLLAAAWGHLPVSLGLWMHDHLIARGVLGGDATRLLKCVPKKVAMFAL